jgi:hypothetical protein
MTRIRIGFSAKKGGVAVIVLTFCSHTPFLQIVQIVCIDLLYILCCPGDFGLAPAGAHLPTALSCDGLCHAAVS